MRKDALDLGELLMGFPDVEYNIEGYPFDYGWDLRAESQFFYVIAKYMLKFNTALSAGECVKLTPFSNIRNTH